MVSDEQFTFHLAPDEYKRMRTFVHRATGGGPPRAYALMAVAYGVLIMLELFHHRWALAAFYVLLSAAWAAFATRSMASRRVPQEGALTLFDAGLAGTLDKKFATIRWTDVSTVSDVGDAIVLLRRKHLPAVAIPKASISDAAAFWAMLEDRLVSKRGVIRSAPPRRQIFNSAC